MFIRQRNITAKNYASQVKAYLKFYGSTGGTVSVTKLRSMFTSAWNITGLIHQQISQKAIRQLI